MDKQPGQRAAVYARISRDRYGAMVAVGRQLEDCRAKAAEMGVRVVEEYTDNDLSAHSRKKPRPKYQKLLEDIRSGLIDVVICWHTDRLHRQVRELEDYIDACSPHTVTTHAVQAGAIDLTTASGLLQARVLAAVAAHEVDHLIERVKRAHEEIARKGGFRGGPRPFGYTWGRRGIEEGEAEVVREMATRVLAGQSVRSIARDLNARGITTSTGRPWAPNAIPKILLRPRNAGLVGLHGEIVGKLDLPAIMDEDTWRQVKAVLENPARISKPRGRPRTFLGSGLYKCGVCGAPVQSIIANVRNTLLDGTKVHYRYPRYRCSTGTGHVGRNMAKVDAYVIEVLLTYLSKQDVRRFVLQTSEPRLSGLDTQINALSAKKGEWREMFNDAVVSRAEFVEGVQSLDARLSRLMETYDRLAQSQAVLSFTGALDLREAWEEATLDERRQVIANTIEVTLLPASAGQGHKHWLDPSTIQIRPLAGLPALAGLDQG